VPQRRSVKSARRDRCACVSAGDCCRSRASSSSCDALRAPGGAGGGGAPLIKKKENTNKGFVPSIRREGVGHKNAGRHQVRSENLRREKAMRKNVRRNALVLEGREEAAQASGAKRLRRNTPRRSCEP
jgi:hypothetical protein